MNKEAIKKIGVPLLEFLEQLQNESELNATQFLACVNVFLLLEIKEYFDTKEEAYLFCKEIVDYTFNHDMVK